MEKGWKWLKIRIFKRFGKDNYKKKIETNCKVQESKSNKQNRGVLKPQHALLDRFQMIDNKDCKKVFRDFENNN